MSLQRMPRDPADHDRLARQYENTAKQLRTKVEEQQKLLQHYEEKSYLYGRQAQDNKSHTEALLNKYQHDVEETMQQAAFHHKMAAQLVEREYTVQPNSAGIRAREAARLYSPERNFGSGTIGSNCARQKV